MNEKLKRLALKLEDSVEYYDIPQQVYDELLELAVKQKDYFDMIGAENIIKLTFLIYSYKRTSSFELGEQMLNDSMFLFTLSSEGNNHREVCQECGGEGQINCQECDGGGEVPCSECGESGEITCDTCNGSGVDPDNEEESCWDCNGAGNLTCPQCNGNTVETCPECYGSRLETCPACDDTGQVETDDWDYNIETILTWNPKLISTSIEHENTLVPIMETVDFNNFYKNYILLNFYGDDYMEFRKGFRADETYCFGHDDNPTVLLSTQRKSIDVDTPWRNLKHYE
jgi:hypothetical protein